MPQRKSGLDELKKDRKRRLRNLDIKTDLRKTVKKYLTSIEAKNLDEAKAFLPTLYKKLDKAAKRNILHKNLASRRKSRFAKLLRSAS